jgi:voltage-gated potassium channel
MWSLLCEWLSSVKNFIRRENLHKLILLIVIVIIVGTLGLSWLESVPLSNALWWTIVTMTTVGYGDITPVTVGGRVIGAVTMLGGIGLLGILTASIASVMVSAKLEGLRGMRTISCTNHFVICGWNHKARGIIDELRADAAAAKSPIVLIADLPDKPIELDDFFFVRGEVTQSTIELANMGQAQAVIVLGDENLDSFSRDARTILSTLTIKSAFPNLYTCIEIVESKNATHGKLAGADELIISGALTTNLLVRATLDHGVTQVVTELLTTYGHELFLTPVPANIVGLAYIEALQQLKTQHDALIVAVLNQQGDLLTNPRTDYHLSKQDNLFIIAEHRPSF